MLIEDSVMAAPMKLKEELFRIAQNGDFEKFKEFIHNHFKSDDTWLELYHNKTGDTVLSFTARGGNTQILEYLKRHGQDFEQANFDGKRALHEAAQYGNLSCVQYLLDQGVDVDALKRADWTPLMLACTKTDLSVIQCLVRAGANPSLVNKDGWNSFHLACREGSVDIIPYLLSIDSHLWQTVSNNGRTPLHTAALHGHVGVVEHLLAACTYDIDVNDSCGATPLMDAVRADFVKMAEVLLTAGSDLYQTDNMGRQCVHLAAQAGAQQALQFLLHGRKVDVNVHSSATGATPLHLAAKEGQEQSIRALLDVGADVFATDSRGRTALQLASGSRHTKCAALLENYGEEIQQKHGVENQQQGLLVAREPAKAQQQAGRGEPTNIQSSS